MAKLVFADGMNGFLEFSENGEVVLMDYKNVNGVTMEAKKVAENPRLSSVAQAIINLSIAAKIDDLGAAEEMETAYWEKEFFPNVVFNDEDYSSVKYAE